MCLLYNYYVYKILNKIQAKNIIIFFKLSGLKTYHTIFDTNLQADLSKAYEQVARYLQL